MAQWIIGQVQQKPYFWRNNWHHPLRPEVLDERCTGRQIFLLFTSQNFSRAKTLTNVMKTQREKLYIAVIETFEALILQFIIYKLSFVSYEN